MAKDKHLYLVLKLNTHIEINGESVKLGDCVGYAPVYDNIEEAKEVAGEKYKIQVITATKPKNHVQTS